MSYRYELECAVHAELLARLLTAEHPECFVWWLASRPGSRPTLITNAPPISVQSFADIIGAKL